MNYIAQLNADGSYELFFSVDILDTNGNPATGYQDAGIVDPVVIQNQINNLNSSLIDLQNKLIAIQNVQAGQTLGAQAANILKSVTAISAQPAPVQP